MDTLLLSARHYLQLRRVENKALKAEAHLTYPNDAQGTIMYSKLLQCYWEFPSYIDKSLFESYDTVDESLLSKGASPGFFQIPSEDKITFAPASKIWLNDWLYATIALLHGSDRNARKHWVAGLPRIFDTFPTEWFDDSIRRKVKSQNDIGDILGAEDCTTLYLAMVIWNVYSPTFWVSMDLTRDSLRDIEK